MLIAGAALLSAVVQFSIFDDLPHVSDATSHVFQARIFAGGHLTAPLPPCYDAFYQHNVVMSSVGMWHTKYFPGQALWLAPGFALRFGGLMMPLGWAIATWAFITILVRLHDESIALLAGSLFALSPMGLLLAGSYMSHTTFLMFALLAGERLLAGIKNVTRPALSWGMAGLYGGFALLTRPQDMVIFLGPGLLLLALRPPQLLHLLRRSLPWLLLGAAPVLVCLLLWNHTLYGDWFSGGYNFNTNHSLTPIIRDSIGFTAIHTPKRALLFTLQTLWRFNQAALGWPLSFLFIPFALLADRKSWGTAALTSIALVIALYALFPYQGFEYEARYYTPALPFIAYLSARGIYTLRSGNKLRSGISALLAAFYLHGAFVYVPTYLWPKYSQDYEQVSPVLERTARAMKLHNALVLVPSEPPDDFRYSSGFVFNDPWLRKDIIYARSRDQSLECLIEAFPNRQILRFHPVDNWKSGSFEPITHANENNRAPANGK